MFEISWTSGPLVAALGYARAGFAVLPLHSPVATGQCSCRRTSCDRVGKHPRVPHGLTEASTDPDQLLAWWTRWPTANLGLRTGGLADVCDIDSAAGRDALRRLLGSTPPTGPVVRTGSGGWHLYLAATGHGNRTRLVPDVDWRGAGGYVVAPPSRHGSGLRYRWIRPFSVHLPPAPAALLRLLAPPPRPSPAPQSQRWQPDGPRQPEGPQRPDGPRPPDGLRRPERYAEAALAAQTGRVADAAVGERNHTLYRAARSLGRLVDAGLLDGRQVDAALTTAAVTAGLGRVETARTLRSARNRPQHALPRPG